MPSCESNVDLMIAESMITKLSVVVHDLVLGFDDLWVVLKVQIARYKATIQFNDLGDLEFAMFWLVETTGSLDYLYYHDKGIFMY